MRHLICLIIVCFLGLTASAKTLVVCTTCAYKSPQQALAAASPGDLILVKAGTYLVQGMIIESRLNLQGEQGAILDGGGQTILNIHADSVTVRDIQLQNVATNYVEDRAAIRCNNADYFRFENVTIRESFFGIHIEKSAHGLIKHCDIQGNNLENQYLESANGNTIHLWYCKDATIEDNVVKYHRDGIYFEFVEDSHISRNWSEGNMRYGLHFMFSHSDTYSENTFTKNGAGVAVMYSTKVLMFDNYFIDNWGESAYGLLLKDITDSELRRNIFENNTIAISADNSSRIELTDNVFSQNGYALRILGNCESNVITRNDFKGNSFDISTNSQSNLNDFSGNYWEEYTGYDLDRDGVGDVPYRPVKLFTSIIAQAPASIILMRSTFIDLLNLAEKITPVLTPANLVDNKPLTKPANDHLYRRP